MLCVDPEDTLHCHGQSVDKLGDALTSDPLPATIGTCHGRMIAQRPPTIANHAPLPDAMPVVAMVRLQAAGVKLVPNVPRVLTSPSYFVSAVRWHVPMLPNTTERQHHHTYLPQAKIQRVHMAWLAMLHDGHDPTSLFNITSHRLQDLPHVHEPNGTHQRNAPSDTLELYTRAWDKLAVIACSTSVPQWDITLERRTGYVQYCVNYMHMG